MHEPSRIIKFLELKPPQIVKISPYLMVATLHHKEGSPEQTKDLTSPRSSQGESGSFEVLDQFLGDLDQKGITLKGLHLLIHLQNAGDDLKRLSALASAIGLSSAGLTGLADQLEDKGLAARVVRRNDRRSIYLALTPAGTKFAARIAKLLGASGKDSSPT